ncbi:DUF397 domain-containing protein [Nocardiopsis sp. CNT312]|uniref:DUF397 domain-containing protein n=1 Tax=Nocardiopsis sp. CNT312 TaxID=1137268 RepID=UPI000491A6FE|nr:DUF397 domain-containing protein [Nocardiopsis sp. CNT312]
MNTDWHKSTYSNTGGHCVEVRELATGTLVRDTQNRALGHLEFPADQWAGLLASVRTDQL